MRYIMICSLLVVCACEPEKAVDNRSSDQKQTDQQERILQEGTAQVGMPAVKNFRERKMLKDIIELRDQAGFVTYTYTVDEHGKKDFLCDSIGYGIPYATQFTSPHKLEYTAYGGCAVGQNCGGRFDVMDQADPNGLFSPAAAEGTWILCKDPNGDKVLPMYVEPRVIVSPFKLDTKPAEKVVK